MKPVAGIIAPAPVQHEKLWRTVTENLAEDKRLRERAREGLQSAQDRAAKIHDKAYEHEIAAGKALVELKATHEAQGGTWQDWEALVKAKAGIAKSRASELMRLATDRMTPEELRAKGAERPARHREKVEAERKAREEKWEANQRARESEAEVSPLRHGENGADPEASADLHRPSLEPEPAKPEPYPTDNRNAYPLALEDAWLKASPSHRRMFVHKYWNEIAQHKTGFNATEIDLGSNTDENRWQEG